MTNSTQAPQAFDPEIDVEDFLEENAIGVEPGELAEPEYDQADLLPLYSEINKNLSKPVAYRHIQWLPGKRDNATGNTGDPVPFIAWNTACDYLDLYAPGWKFHIVARTETPTHTIVHSRLFIPHRHGVAEFDGLGEIVTAAKGFGSPGERAQSKSLRRAAALAGLARHLYRKSGRPAPPAEMMNGGRRYDPPARPPDTRNPIGRGGGPGHTGRGDYR